MKTTPNPSATKKSRGELVGPPPPPPELPLLGGFVAAGGPLAEVVADMAVGQDAGEIL